MARAAALRGRPASKTSTRRRHRPSTSAALSPAGPPPTIRTSCRAEGPPRSTRPSPPPEPFEAIRLAFGIGQDSVRRLRGGIPPHGGFVPGPRGRSREACAIRLETALAGGGLLRL